MSGIYEPNRALSISIGERSHHSGFISSISLIFQSRRRFFKSLFAGYGLLWAVMDFEPNQAIDAVPCREPWHAPFLVLVNAASRSFVTPRYSVPCRRLARRYT